MRRETKSRTSKTNLQAQMSMGGGFAGESSRRYTASPRSVKSKGDTNNKGPKHLGLYCRETWQLSGSKEYPQSGKVRHKRRKLRESQHRRPYVDKVTSDEERSILRASSKIDEGRKYFRAIRRFTPRNGSKKPSKITQVRAISDIKEEENCFVRARKMESLRHNMFGSGFSASGDLDEQQSAWIPKTFQTETAMGMGYFKPWEDFDDNESDQIFSDLYDSDGCTSS